MKNTRANVIKVAEIMADKLITLSRYYEKEGDTEQADCRFWEGYGIETVIEMLKDENKFKQFANIWLKED